MSLSMFLLCLLVISTFTTMFVECWKKLLVEIGKPYRSNALAAITSVALSIIVFIGYVIMTESAINAKMAVYLVALILLSWLSSMLGYDKVVQAISQFKVDKEG